MPIKHAVAPRSDAVLPASVSATPSALQRGVRSVNPLAARYEALDAERQKGSVLDKVRRRAERARLIAGGRGIASRLEGEPRTAVTLAASRLEQFSRDIELARVSADVYNEQSSVLGWTRLSDSLDQLPPALRRPELWRNDNTDFRAGLYKEADELGGRVVLAYRGTVHTEGWLTDGAQSNGVRTEQYAAARRLAQLVRSAYGSNVAVTGHSLNGGLASEASAVTGARGATFNPAGLDDESLHDTGHHASDAASRITDYHVATEVLSDLQSPVGRALLAPSSTLLHLGLAATGQLGRPAGLRDLLPTTIPGPTGQHVELPSVRAAEVPLFTSGIRHTGIFPIQAMEEQKELDRATIESYTGSMPGAN